MDGSGGRCSADDMTQCPACSPPTRRLISNVGSPQLRRRLAKPTCAGEGGKSETCGASGGGAKSECCIGFECASPTDVTSILSWSLLSFTFGSLLSPRHIHLLNPPHVHLPNHQPPLLLSADVLTRKLCGLLLFIVAMFWLLDV
jgi:hypothetical protein